ncbi:MAG: hypothetical protein EOR45_08175 [Mesorhizobium sp.]|nr:MAG: hypothetical protein EOR45_08175 [Mesorhizobium sp.]
MIVPIEVGDVGVLGHQLVEIVVLDDGVLQCLLIALKLLKGRLLTPDLQREVLRKIEKLLDSVPGIAQAMGLDHDLDGIDIVLEFLEPLLHEKFQGRRAFLEDAEHFQDVVGDGHGCEHWSDHAGDFRDARKNVQNLGVEPKL